MIKKKSKAQKEAAKQRTVDKKLWEKVREQVRKRDDYQCAICGQKKYIQVHHLISREIKELWLDINNLICLCPKHHKFSQTSISFHGNSMFAAIWLMTNRPSTWNWLIEKTKLYDII